MIDVFATEERQHSPSIFQLAKATKAGRVVDFCYLSNKFFPNEALIGRLSENFEDMVRNYPSMQKEQARLAAAITGYRQDQILVGNGASELIHLVAARTGRRWLMPFPSYMEYENVLRDFGKHLQMFQLTEASEFRVEVDRMLKEIETHSVDAVVLPNPNSPTGQRLELENLFELLERGRALDAVVVDESFIEFTSARRDQIPTLRPYLDKYPNLVLVRSLGKDFGVCGLRLGLVASANPKFLEEIRRFLPIWNISPFAERFLRLCAEHMEDYERGRITCVQETRKLAEGLRSIPGLQVYDTYSNFVLFKILNEKVTSERLRDHLLLERGFYVRDCSRKLGLGNRFIRVGANLPSENNQLVEAIASFLKSA